MATRRKTTTKAAEVETEHICEKAGELGIIEARLDGQEDTDKRIEESLQKLMENHNSDTTAIRDRFSDISVKLAKIGTVLETSAEQNKQLIQNQNDILKHLNSVTKNTDLLEQTQLQFQKTIEDHIVENDKWKSDMSERVHKLELAKYFWYALGGIVVAMLGALSYVATIYDVFSDKTPAPENNPAPYYQSAKPSQK